MLRKQTNHGQTLVQIDLLLHMRVYELQDSWPPVYRMLLHFWASDFLYLVCVYIWKICRLWIETSPVLLCSVTDEHWGWPWDGSCWTIWLLTNSEQSSWIPQWYVLYCYTVCENRTALFSSAIVIFIFRFQEKPHWEFSSKLYMFFTSSMNILFKRVCFVAIYFL